MGMISMKVHQFARGLWAEPHETPSLSLGCKRLRPLAPKLSHNSSSSDTTTTITTCSPPANHGHSFDLKSFIRPDCGPRRPGCSDDNNNKTSSQVETHPGGTRWNPTQEQIGILESLYRTGMRTPNAQQIEHITTQLSKFGKIEGKNVFYWFQNHKARERQKQKRHSLGLAHTPRTPIPIPIPALNPTGDIMESTSPYKRKCMSWGSECLLDDHYISSSNNNRNSCNTLYFNYDNQDRDQMLGNRTLELFPLHPEGR